jgi:hypothetical protein
VELIKEMKQHPIMKQHGQHGRKTKEKSQTPTKVLRV